MPTNGDTAKAAEISPTNVSATTTEQLEKRVAELEQIIKDAVAREQAAAVQHAPQQSATTPEMSSGLIEILGKLLGPDHAEQAPQSDPFRVMGMAWTEIAMKNMIKLIPKD